MAHDEFKCAIPALAQAWTLNAELPIILPPYQPRLVAGN